MEILAIIQARGGSKGIPGKNIKELAGKPLIAWTVEAARGSKKISRTIVSTDDAAIAEVARAAGAEVPFLRPAEYAQDGSKSIDLLLHALTELGKHDGYKPDIVVQLKPTNPLRTSQHIDDCIEAYLVDPSIDSLITVVKSPAHPFKTYAIDDGGFATPFIPESVSGIKEASKQPRQKLPAAYVQNSCVNVINPRTLFEQHSSLGKRVKGFIMAQEESTNIDTLLDFRIAEMLLRDRMNV
ncbi:MAG: acylneuraminate cytidylyltransferase family protein [Patescibacteria group bacterium]